MLTDAEIKQVERRISDAVWEGIKKDAEQGQSFVWDTVVHYTGKDGERHTIEVGQG